MGLRKAVVSTPEPLSGFQKILAASALNILSAKLRGSWIFITF